MSNDKMRTLKCSRLQKWAGSTNTEIRTTAVVADREIKEA